MTPEFLIKRDRLIALRDQLRDLNRECEALNKELQGECVHEVILEGAYEYKPTRTCIVCALSETEYSFPAYRCRLHGSGSEIRKVDYDVIQRHHVLRPLKTTLTTT